MFGISVIREIKEARLAWEEAVLNQPLFVPEKLDQREPTSTPERYGVWMERRRARMNAEAATKGAVTTSTATGKIQAKPPTGTDWRTRRMQPTSGGWVAGEKQEYADAQDDNVNVIVDLRTVAEQTYDHERDVLASRAVNLIAEYAFEIAMAETKRAKRGLGNKRDWILDRMREEWTSIEISTLSDDELLELQETVRHDEEQALDEIACQSRREGEKEEKQHQKDEEAKVKVDDAKLAWTQERLIENKDALEKSLNRYYKQFGDGTWNMTTTTFPMWEKDDETGRWTMVQYLLCDVFDAEIKKRGEGYKALWTLSKMIDSRYDAQLKYAAKQRKRDFNKKVAEAKAADAATQGGHDADWWQAMCA